MELRLNYRCSLHTLNFSEVFAQNLKIRENTVVSLRRSKFALYRFHDEKLRVRERKTLSKNSLNRI
jgi:hypothetical protein